ncbi:serine protease [Microcoleus sp. herbarium8]|uniref:trypsin-like serine peptidase n=1 Tax=Microcoleus sp. herbarium8 TaxID=3055436 RepID=UPI002FD40269
MNEIPQTMALQCPSLTLYAFHLRNSINQGLQPTVSAAPRLWEQLVDLGNVLHIRELQILRQKLICYEGNRYFPEAEDLWGAEYLTLLENNEPSLYFQVPLQAGGLELQGLLCPFRLHDTYAIDLTLCSQDTLTLAQLNYLNPQNLILQNIQASLGKTLLLFGQPKEAQKDNYQVLADACVAQLCPGKHSIHLVDTGSLLGNPIFEYESGLTNPANKLHILVWLKCHDMSSNHMDRVAETLLHLLWCRHKILYVYQQSHWCVIQAKKLYGILEQYRNNYSQVSEKENRRSHLLNLHAKLQQLELDYTNYLDDLTEHEKTITINYINYKTYLEKLEKLPATQLSFCQDFLQYVGNKLQRQIQVDRDYLGMGRDRLQRLKATVRESITTEPVASEPWSGQGSGEQECKSALALQKELHYYGNNTLKINMPGIPRDIYPRLRQALSDCDQFKNHGRLFDFFDANEPLQQWCDDLPEVDNRTERAEKIISYLVRNPRSDGQNNVLILLCLLKDQIDPIKQLYQTLSGLLQELTPILSGASSNSNVVPFPTQTNINSQSLPKAELALEANPKGEPMSSIVADAKQLNCARSVACVSVPQIVSDNLKKIPTGTGWLVTPNLALTCWHVIEARDPRQDSLIRESDLQKQITNSTFTFDFTQPGEGIEYGIERLEHKDVNLDYALLRLRDRTDSPLKKWGFLKLDADVPLTLKTQFYVIQHPKGLLQHRSGGVFVKEASNTKILHNSPTEPGTSGAPVLNAINFRVVALHNGERESEKLREATTIKAILADIKQHRPELYDEIVAVQNPNQE